MTDLFAARSQMAMSLGFHIVFAVVGIAMPMLMVIAEALWLRTGDAMYQVLARRWAKGTAVLFAVGAVSGTVLSFELGLLWPKFMDFAGPIIGMPFSLEGFAFFLEAIFLGIYLYGWDRVPPGAHLASGVMVMLCGSLSGIFVVSANGWMNAPTGFELGPDGEILSIDPIAAMLNPAAAPQAAHMAFAAFAAVGMAVAGIHAFALLKQPDHPFHRRAFGIALAVGAVFSVLMPISGHTLGEHVMHHQPAKFAAMEGVFETTTSAGMEFGSIPDAESRSNRGGIEIPYLLSLMATSDPWGEVPGLDQVPEDEWPPLVPVRISYQVMILSGVTMVGIGLLGAGLALFRRRLPVDRWYLWLVIAGAPLGTIAIEAGWTVTEVGRQPWVIWKLMRTSEAVTPMPGLTVPFLVFTGVYVILALVVFTLMRRLVADVPELEEDGADGA